MNEMTDLLSRQRLIFGDGLENKAMTILGVGGIGSNVAHIAASVGIEKIFLIDFDDVAEENLYPGFFSGSVDLGANKAHAVAGDLLNRLSIDSEHRYIDFMTFSRFSQLRGSYTPIMMVCTDNIESRMEMWEFCKGKDCLYIDGRMGGVEAEVYAFRANDEDAAARYEPTLEGEFAHLPCGMKATAAMTKGWIPGMVGQVLYDISIGRDPQFKQQYSLGNRMLLKPGANNG